MAIVTDKLAFYHIPRTGGTWVRNTLDRYNKRTPIGIEFDEWKHEPPTVTPVPEGRMAFTVVRDPADWLGSWYRYLIQYETGFRDRIHKAWLFKGCRRNGFGFFVRDYLDLMPGGISAAWLEFIDNVDVVLHQVSLQEGLKELLAMAGMTGERIDRFAPPCNRNATPEEIKTQIDTRWAGELLDEFYGAEWALYDRLMSLERIGAWLSRGNRKGVLCPT